MFFVSGSLSASLISTLVPILLLTWYLKFLWSRRKLYYYGSKVRGPISFPIIGSSYKFVSVDGSSSLNVLGDFANEYSGFYRLWMGTNLKFFVTIPEYIEKILTNPNALDKSHDYAVLEPIVSDNVFTVPASRWKLKRKLLNNFLSKKNLNDFMTTNVKYALKTVNNIKKEIENAREIDIEDAIANISFDATIDIVFSEKPKLLTKEYNAHTIERILEAFFQRLYTLRYKYYRLFLLTKLGKSMAIIINSIKWALDETIQIRRKEIYQNEKTTTIRQSALIDFMLTQYKEMEEDPQRLLIRDEIITFIVASVEPPGRAANFMLLVLGLFPNIQENIYREVVSVCGKSDPIDWKQIQELKYLDRVFKETLRLFPIAPLIGRTCTDDIPLGDGTILPKGSEVGILILYLQRLEKYWPDPLKFDPDRFLPDNVTKRAPCTYLPFSHGPRNCAGMMQARLCVKTTVAHFVREFHVTTDYKSIEEIDLNVGLSLSPKAGYKLHFQLRDNYGLGK